MLGAIAVLAACLLAVPSLAEPDERRTTYRSTDVAGNLHVVQGLSQVPAAYRSRARPVGGARAPTINRSKAAPRPAKRPFSQVPEARPRSEVIVYTTSWCGWCRKTLAWLDERGVRYENRDIEKDPRNRAELLERTGRTTIPVVVIGGRVIRGYQPERMAGLL